MNKDIIYIDVEDDVTSVIGKVRASEQKIVALVPPKNIGSLQSAVNLRLLQKAADSAGKRIVLITNNSGLTALAAGVKIPVAKNLQSKPEIPIAPEKPVAGEDDVINGDELPVGELAAATAEGNAALEAGALGTPAGAPKPSDDDFTIVGDLPDLEKEAPALAAAATGATKAKKGGVKVPNFGRFRKWIFIGGGLVVAIIALLVLTNIFWTNANVVIAAQTSDEALDLPLTLTTEGTTNPDQGTIKSEAKQLKKTASVDFTATGKKNVGNKATGTVRFSTNSISNLGTTIPAGTELTSSSGTVFTTDASVTITINNYQNAPTTVTATEPGESSNGATGAVSGAPSGINASLTAATGGGTDKNVTVVTAEDVTAATAKLANNDATAAKSELTGQFGKDYIVIGESFKSQDADPVSAPAVGQEATTAKLTRDSTYNLVAIKKDQIKVLSTNYLSAQLNGDSQKIYTDGSGSATITQFITSPSGVMTAHVKTTGKIGPNIDEKALKTQLAGKKAAEITEEIKRINGVKDVKVSFAPFWRTTAPDSDKITVSFDLNNNGK